MNPSKIGITVAGLIAAAAASSNASANSYTLYASGASAQRSFWESDLGYVCTGTRTTPATKWTVITQALADGAKISLPDIEAVQCIITTGAQLGSNPSTITIGDTLTLQYAAELGSVWGIAPFIPGNKSNLVGRSFIDITNATVCPTAGGQCTVNGYDRLNDTATTGLATPVAPDIGLTDAEPGLWAASNNWPLVTTPNGNAYPILGDATTGLQPTAGQIGTYANNSSRVNGQVLSFVVNTAAPTGSLTSLSRESLIAIFTGQYTNWGGVPEVGGGNTTPIVVCRRDHGSGTEVTASVTLTAPECGAGTAVQIVQARNGKTLAHPGKLCSTCVIENSTTNDMVACVTANVGAIGIRSLSTSSSYVTLQIDGVEANAHNAASGRYPYAYDAYVYTGSSTLTGGKLDIANALITDAATAANLAAETGTATGFLWTTGGAAQRGAFAGQYGPGGTLTPNITSWSVTSGAAPEALWNQSGNSCNAKVDTQAP